jgi:glycosyltransferase 2 family protein
VGGASDSAREVPPRRSPLRAIVRGLGVVLAVLAVVFCIKTLVVNWSSIRPALVHANRWWLVVALVSTAVGMTGLGLLWWACLRLFRVHTRITDAVAWYFGGELGKYIPGGVWQVLGRAELAMRGGLRRGTVYATTLMCYAAMLVGAAVTSGILAPLAAVGGGHIGWAGLIFLLVPVGIVSAHPAVTGRILGLASRITGGRVTLSSPSWNRMLGLIAQSIPSWVLVGASSCAFTAALGYHQHPARVAFAALVGWIVGFLAIAVPAGAGVREVTFIALAGLPSGPAVAVAALSRLGLVVVDAVGGLVGLWYARRAGRGRQSELASSTASGADQPYPDRSPQ